MTRYLLSFLALAIFALGSSAQNAPRQHHHTQSANIIDGSQTPELIPDDTAFRLWLVAVSTPLNTTQEERSAQKAHLGRLSFKTEEDHIELQLILTEFKSQYLTLINRYNEAATKALASGSQPDQALFLRQRDDLVAATRVALKSRLTSSSFALINDHIKGEKKYMRVQLPKEAAQ